MRYTDAQLCMQTDLKHALPFFCTLPISRPQSSSHMSTQFCLQLCVPAVFCMLQEQDLGNTQGSNTRESGTAWLEMALHSQTPQGSLLPDGPAARSGTILQSWRSSVCVARTHVPLERQGTTTVAEAKRPTLPLLGEVSADITFTGVTVAVAEGT